MKEIWKAIKGYEGLYEISDLGRVKSLERIVNRKNHNYKIKERILKQNFTTYGYYRTSLCKNGIHYKPTIHRLVAENFLTKNNDNLQVNHINGIKTDNRLTNLEWVTQLENMQHAHNTGLINNSGENHFRAKLTKDDVLEIRELYKTTTAKKLGEKYNVNKMTIYKIVKRKLWKHIKEVE